MTADDASRPVSDTPLPEALEHSPGDALAPYAPPDATREVSTRISHNVRWNLVGHVWGFAVTLVATPLVIRRLGVDAYGIIAALAVVTNYMAFLDLGISQASIKYVAEHKARRDWQKVSAVFWTSLALYAILALVAAGLVAGLASLAATRLFRIPPALQREAFLSFLVGAAGIFLVLLTFAPSSLTRGLERFDIANKVGIAVGTIQPLLTLFLVLVGATLPTIVAGSVLVLAAALLWYFSALKNVFPQLKPPAYDADVLRRLLHFGGYLAAASLLAPIAVSAEKFLLAGSVSVAALTFYMVPLSVVSRLAIIPASFSSALFPTFSTLQAVGEGRNSEAINIQVARTLVYLFIPILLALLLFGETLLRWWMGAEFAASSGIILKILAIAAFIQALSWTPHVLIQAFGRSDLTFRVYLVQVVLYVPVAYVCVRNWGLTGAALAWTVRVVLDTGLVWYYARMLQGGSIWRVLSERRVCGALLGLGAAAVASFGFVGFGWRILATAGAVVGLLSVAGPVAVIVKRMALGKLAEGWGA